VAARFRPRGRTVDTAGGDSPIGRAFKNRTSNVQVEGEGVVTRLLADDSLWQHASAIHRSPQIRSDGPYCTQHDIAPRVRRAAERRWYTLLRRVRVERKGRYGHWTHHDRKGGTRQVGSNTEGGHISNTLWMFLGATQTIVGQYTADVGLSLNFYEKTDLR